MVANRRYYKRTVFSSTFEKHSPGPPGLQKGKSYFIRIYKKVDEFQNTFKSSGQERFRQIRAPDSFKDRQGALILAENPYLSGTEAVKDKRLAQFRIRIGDYRILYDVYPKDKVVYILRVGHRKDIYR